MYKFAKKFLSRATPWPSGTQITFKGIERTERPAAVRWAFDQKEFGNIVKIKFED
jgi:hypothetical protein